MLPAGHEPLMLSAARRALVAAAPVAVPVSMWALFRVLAGQLTPRAAYNVGFAVYWLGWCLGFPVYVLGPRGALHVLRTGRGPTAGEWALLLFPVAGGAGTQLLPHRREIDAQVALVMAGTAVLNAGGEELLWRGMFLAAFPRNPVVGAVWPLVGFTVWHLAPQVILPSRMGRGRFLLGAAAVGLASTVTAWRGGGLRAVLLPHIATDACGVAAARYRLGRAAP